MEKVSKVLRGKKGIAFGDVSIFLFYSSAQRVFGCQMSSILPTFHSSLFLLTLFLLFSPSSIFFTLEWSLLSPFIFKKGFLRFKSTIKWLTIKASLNRIGPFWEARSLRGDFLYKSRELQRTYEKKMTKLSIAWEGLETNVFLLISHSFPSSLLVQEQFLSWSVCYFPSFPIPLKWSWSWSSS